jgi:hypothetical protein
MNNATSRKHPYTLSCALVNKFNPQCASPVGVMELALPGTEMKTPEQLPIVLQVYISFLYPS